MSNSFLLIWSYISLNEWILYFNVSSARLIYGKIKWIFIECECVALSLFVVNFQPSGFQTAAHHPHCILEEVCWPHCFLFWCLLPNSLEDELRVLFTKNKSLKVIQITVIQITDLSSGFPFCVDILSLQSYHANSPCMHMMCTTL